MSLTVLNNDGSVFGRTINPMGPMWMPGEQQQAFGRINSTASPAARPTPGQGGIPQDAIFRSPAPSTGGAKAPDMSAYAAGRAQPTQTQSQGTPYGQPSQQQQPANPFANMAPGVYYGGQQLPGDQQQALATAMAQRDAMALLVNNNNMQYSLANAFGQNLGPPRFDYQSALQQAQNMVANGFYNPFTQFFNQATDPVSQLGQYAPPPMYSPGPQPFPPIGGFGVNQPTPPQSAAPPAASQPPPSPAQQAPPRGSRPSDWLKTSRGWEGPDGEVVIDTDTPWASRTPPVPRSPGPFPMAPPQPVVDQPVFRGQPGLSKPVGQRTLMRGDIAIFEGNIPREEFERMAREELANPTPPFLPPQTQNQPSPRSPGSFPLSPSGQAQPIPPQDTGTPYWNFLTPEENRAQNESFAKRRADAQVARGYGNEPYAKRIEDAIDWEIGLLNDRAAATRPRGSQGEFQFNPALLTNFQTIVPTRASGGLQINGRQVQEPVRTPMTPEEVAREWVFWNAQNLARSPEYLESRLSAQLRDGTAELMPDGTRKSVASRVRDRLIQEVSPTVLQLLKQGVSIDDVTKRFQETFDAGGRVRDVLAPSATAPRENILTRNWTPWAGDERTPPDVMQRRFLAEPMEAKVKQVASTASKPLDITDEMTRWKPIVSMPKLPLPWSNDGRGFRRIGKPEERTEIAIGQTYRPDPQNRAWGNTWVDTPFWVTPQEKLAHMVQTLVRDHGQAYFYKNAQINPEVRWQVPSTQPGEFARSEYMESEKIAARDIIPAAQELLSKGASWEDIERRITSYLNSHELNDSVADFRRTFKDTRSRNAQQRAEAESAYYDRMAPINAARQAEYRAQRDAPYQQGERSPSAPAAQALQKTGQQAALEHYDKLNAAMRSPLYSLQQATERRKRDEEAAKQNTQSIIAQANAARARGQAVPSMFNGVLLTQGADGTYSGSAPRNPIWFTPR